MYTLQPLAIAVSVAALVAAGPSLAQSSLASSGNLGSGLVSTSGGNGVVSTTGAQPNWPHDPHQSTSVASASAAKGGANAYANGGDLAPNLVVNKTVGSNPSTASNSVTGTAEAGSVKDNDLLSGVTARGLVTRADGGQQTTTFRQLNLNAGNVTGR